MLSQVSPASGKNSRIYEPQAWQSLIDAGQFANVHELANTIGKDYAYVARVLRLTLLAPEIVHAILTGALPDGIGVEDLRQSMPVLWSEQKKLLNME